MKFFYSLLFLSGLLLLCSSCSPPKPSTIREIEPPAARSSHLPYLVNDGSGNTFLSWVEKIDSTTSALKYARLNGTSWSEPSVIAQGSDWFVNWADFPSIAAENGEPRAAHWLHKIPGNTYSYEVRVAMADRSGSGWGPSLTPHKDSTATEHGFVSMIPWQEDRVLAAWLDGRRTAGRSDDEYGDLSKAMTLRSALISHDGIVTGSILVDESVCDCCQTSMAETSYGAILAYRDRTGEEIRDIYVSRFRDGSWSEPMLVHEDGWKIGGCPVNGPAVAADNDGVLVAWFTGADEKYRVKAAFSADGGASFSPPIEIDGGNPVGRVDAAFVGPETAAVSWMEKTDTAEGAELRVRLVNSNGNSAGSPVTITPMDPDRSSGFPRMVFADSQLLFAWTETGDPYQVRMASIPVDLLQQ